MKRKNEEIFEDGYGHQYQAFETYLSFPSKCRLCCLYDEYYGCQGNLEITGDCLPLREEKKPIELIFCEVPKTI